MKIFYKNIAITLFSVLSISAMAQVKIGANPTVITTNAKLEVEGSTGKKVTILDNGNTGIGTNAPTNVLHVNATADPLKLTGVQGATTAISPLGIDASGVVKSLNMASSTQVLDPKDASAFNNRGNAYQVGKKDYDRAIADYNQAIQLDPKFAAAFNNRGLAKQAKGDAAGRDADIAQARQLQPGIGQ